MKGKKVLCVIQARMGSTRLPGKVLMKIQGKTLLEYLLMRLKRAKKIDKAVIATTTKLADEQIVKLCKKLKAASFRGSEEDVLDRYYQCAKQHPGYNVIVRLTADCPLIDPKVIDQVVEFFHTHNYGYVTNNFLKNTEEETFPDGMDVEVFTREVLELSAKRAKLNSEREHVTPYMRKIPKIKKGRISAPYDFSHIRLTVDEKADFEVVKFLIQRIGIDADYMSYVAMLTKHPEVMLKNAHIKRNAWYWNALKNDFTVKKITP